MGRGFLRWITRIPRMGSGEKLWIPEDQWSNPVVKHEAIAQDIIGAAGISRMGPEGLAARRSEKRKAGFGRNWRRQAGRDGIREEKKNTWSCSRPVHRHT